MRVASLFSGIGCIDLGLERAGHEVIVQVEIDKQCRDILRRHWPHVPRVFDVRQLKGEWLRERGVDLIAGGFPCTNTSIAGGRSGLAGEASGLWWEFHRIIEEARPEWVLVENVPGLLSVKKGRDFGAILRSLDELGYGVAWASLDAQYFGLAQRRKRVFLIGHLGDPYGPAEVLLEPESLCGSSPPSREEGSETSSTLGTGASASGGFRIDLDSGGGYVVEPVAKTLPSVHRGVNECDKVTYVIRMREGKPGGGKGPLVSEDRSLTLAGGNDQIIIFDPRQLGNPNDRTTVEEGNLAPVLGSQSWKQPISVATEWAVRRLTPLEYERLQGLPDGWTDGQADTTRYRQVGNGCAVQVIEWIGEGLAVYEDVESIREEVV